MQLPATLTMAQAAAALAELQAAPSDGEQVTIDASQLADFDSAALALLLHARRLAQQRGQRLAVHGAPSQLAQLARLYGVAELLPLAPTAPAAPSAPPR
jgi:phospholipid transport system transporter-binding protein